MLQFQPDPCGAVIGTIKHAEPVPDQQPDPIDDHIVVVDDQQRMIRRHLIFIHTNGMVSSIEYPSGHAFCNSKLPFSRSVLSRIFRIPIPAEKDPGSIPLPLSE